MSSKKPPFDLSKLLGMLDHLRTVSAPDDLKERARDFLQNGLTGHSIADVQRAYNGLLAAQTCLGPVHRDIRNSLESARKTLADFQKVVTKRDCLFELAREELVPVWEQIQDIFRQYATAEQRELTEPWFAKVLALLKGESVPKPKPR